MNNNGLVSMKMWKGLKYAFLFLAGTSIYILVSPHFIKEKTIIRVEKGMSVQDIFHSIPKEKFWSYGDILFQITSWIYQKKYRYILPGIYHIPENSSLLNVMHILVTEPQLCKITIPEGWTVHQILRKIKSTPSLSEPHPSLPLEGAWFPETYYYSNGTLSSLLINNMVSLMKKHCKALRKLYPLPKPLKNDQEWIILASIIERETPKISERPHVASVYLNRLKKNMRLQADPTVIYGISPYWLNRPLTKKDLAFKTEYNTYQNTGLPPTPICCPSKASLQAALKPLASNDLFFVADGKGGHVFSESFEEHKKHVRNWRKVEKILAKNVSDKE